MNRLENVEVETLSALPITRQNSKKFFFRKETEQINHITYNYIPTLNIPLLKNILYFLFGFLGVCRRSQERPIIICDVLNFSVIAGAVLASRLLGLKSVGIVTDLPTMLSPKKGLYSLLNNKIIQYFKSYVFMTEQMNQVINLKQKPYLVIEGQVDLAMEMQKNDLAEKRFPRICMYAGGIQRIYGVPELVEAFIKVDIPDAELHIYGDGDYANELTNICLTHNKVKYFGTRLNSEIVKAEIEASLLINPRPTHELYTKYSFPSKNMEYMASGTPVLTTRLPGMPKEYEEFVYLINDETIDGIGEALVSVLSDSREVLHQKGRGAKAFVMRTKNNMIQAKKIIDMVNGL
ncbi:MAG: glycosyltransferase [Acutalibacteraceae bacterium]|uniref:glycosyltransferase n=2 Tax=Candidatus Fimivicinus sp. TaxID=3056640 RepID=UPI003A493C14